MAHVIGLHLYKGNSNISHWAGIKQGQILTEGMAVQVTSFDPMVVEKLVTGGKFAGFVCDVYKDANTCNLVVASAGLPLPAGAGWTVGEQVSIDLTTAIIGTGAVGERKTNATILDGAARVIDGKTGVESDGVVIRFGMAEDMGNV